MIKNMFLLVLIIFFVGCETGERYDKNSTIQKMPKHESKSKLVERDDIEALLDDKDLQEDLSFSDKDDIVSEEIHEILETVEENSFIKVTELNALDVRRIREGKHEGYIRLVFDIYSNSKPAKLVGQYTAKHNTNQKDISIVLHGYQKFSAPLPSFPYYSIIEQIHFDQYPKYKGFKFHIKLRTKAKVRIFALKNPARLVFDIKAI